MDTKVETQPIEPKTATDLLMQMYQRQQSEAQNASRDYTSAQNKYAEYLKNRDGRNPVASIIEASKPQRDTAKEKRLRNTAMWAAINDGISAIGKSIANAGGVRTTPLQPNKPLYNSMAELNRLDEIYRQEGYRYDGLKLTDALRKKQQEDAIAENALSQARANAIQAQKDAQASGILAIKEQTNNERENRSNAIKWQMANEANRARLGAAMVGAQTRNEAKNNINKPLFNIKYGEQIVPIYDYMQNEVLNWAEKRGMIKRGQTDDGSFGRTDYGSLSPAEQQAKFLEFFNAYVEDQNKPTADERSNKDVWKNPLLDNDQKSPALKISSNVLPNKMADLERLFKTSDDRSISRNDALLLLGEHFPTERDLEHYLIKNNIKIIN